MTGRCAPTHRAVKFARPYPLYFRRPTHLGKSSDRALFPKQRSPQGPEGGGRVGHEGVYGSRGDYDAG